MFTKIRKQKTASVALSGKNLTITFLAKKIWNPYTTFIWTPFESADNVLNSFQIVSHE